MAEKLETRIVVFVNIRDETGRLLLQRRSNTGFMDGYYDFACSGHVDVGESVLEAAVREAREEIGIIARPDDLKLVHINQNYLDRPYANFTFELHEWEGEPTICEPEKCNDLSYFAPDALPEKCTLNVRLNERNGFSSELTYSKVTPENLADIMGANYDELYLRQ